MTLDELYAKAKLTDERLLAPRRGASRLIQHKWVSDQQNRKSLRMFIKEIAEPLAKVVKESLTGWKECPECGIEDMAEPHALIEPPIRERECSIGGLRDALATYNALIQLEEDCG